VAHCCLWSFCIQTRYHMGIVALTGLILAKKAAPRLSS
jgi:hypothetical protein